MGLIDNLLIQSQLPDGWLTVWEVQAQLQLSYQGTLRWIRKHVPPEYKGKRGYHRIVHIDGLKVGLEKCVWRSQSPRGYQGHPGRLPVNVNCRDSNGRFISHRPPGTPRPPRAKKGMDSSRRRKYLTPEDSPGSQADCGSQADWKSSRRNKYPASDAPSGKVRDE